jgi:hypothetical protein
MRRAGLASPGAVCRLDAIAAGVERGSRSCCRALPPRAIDTDVRASSSASASAERRRPRKR